MGQPEESRRTGPVGRVLRTPYLRRLESAYAGFSISEHATWLAVLVYAFQRGGAREVGVVVLVQLLPAVALTPFSSYAGDRFPPRTALTTGYAVQSLAMACTAAAMWADAPVLAYAAATVTAVSISFVRPVMGSILPRVTHRPSDLVAANVVSGLVEQAGVFLGPLLAGALIAVWSPAAVFATTAAVLGCGAVAVLRVRSEQDLSADRPDAVDALRTVFAGFGSLRAPRLRMFVLLVAVAGIVKGVGDLAFVTLAEERLDGGGGLSGLLSGTYGLGGVSGALLVGQLVRRRGTSTTLAIAGLCVAGGVAVAAFADRVVPAMLGLAAMGAGEAALMITAILSIQREAPTRVLARLFGVVEGALMGSIAVGSVTSSTMAAHLSLRAALLWASVGLLVAIWLVATVLRRIGGEPSAVDDAVVERLVEDPVFAPLAAPTIERLARSARIVDVEAGRHVVRQGEPGDDYFLIDDGTVDVQLDDVHVRFLAAGSSFGEIALLRSVPRTASVVAVTRCRLVAIERDQFLAAVTGHQRAFTTATDTANRYLADASPGADPRPSADADPHADPDADDVRARES